VSGGSAFALASTASIGDASFERRFGLFSAGAAPGSAFVFATKVSGSQVGSSGGGGATVEARVHEVEMVLKTPAVYYDSTTLQVAYQVRDEGGRTRILRSGLAIVLVASTTTTSLTASSTCGTPDSTSGVGTCTMRVPSSWFSVDADIAGNVRVDAKYNGIVVSSSVSKSILVGQKPTFTSLTSAGMIATVPHHPLMPGHVHGFNSRKH